MVTLANMRKTVSYIYGFQGGARIGVAKDCCETQKCPGNRDLVTGALVVSLPSGRPAFKRL